MKCPKCGYLGFDTPDRCRNCGYEFSLAPFLAEPDFALNRADSEETPFADLDLASADRPADHSSPEPLDLDRLFGASAGDPPVAVPTRAAKPAALSRVESSALPFDDAPPAGAPPSPRPPLAVRRATPEAPRRRPRTTRPLLLDPPLATGVHLAPPAATGDTGTRAMPAMEPASPGARLGAFTVDVLLLAAVDIAVLILTLRMAELALTWPDMRLLPPVPLTGFLALLNLGYLAAFTVADGQTVGKMLAGIRVIGDDGRPVDTSGGVLRALGCGLLPLTFGLTYLPAFVTSDRRAVHDRIAGTRVVQT